MPISRVLFCAFAIAAITFAPVATQAAEKLDRLVTITGEGTVAAVPDSAVIRVGVSSQGKTARAASDANAHEMNIVLAAMKDSGIAERDVQTTSLSLQPQYDTRQPGGARLVGFRVNNQITVRVRDISKLAALLDRAIAAGANEMSGIEFRVSNEAKLLDQARGAAIADAHRKAELYAHAAGMQVGRVVAISEEGAAAPLRGFAPMRAAAPTAIAAGEQTLRVVVTVSYELGS
jgi:uncharacterized protein